MSSTRPTENPERTERVPSDDEIYAGFFEKCRTDFCTFAELCLTELNPRGKIAHNFHLEAMAFELNEVIEGRCHNLMINIPPRYAKSIFVSVALPAYLLGIDPAREILVVSHSLELAAKLASQFRRIMNAPWYPAVFPNTQLARDSEFEVVTTKGGGRRAASITGSLTGLGGDPLIFDDPLNVADAYSDTTRRRINELVRLALSRQDDKLNGSVIMAMQRLHEDDPCGSLLADCENDWRLLSLSAVAEEEEIVQIGKNRYHRRRVGEELHADREPIDILERIKSRLGAASFAAQYQQKPMPAARCIFRREWLQWVDSAPRLISSGGWVVQAWDTALKADGEHDYAACVTVLIKDGQYYVLDVSRDRVEFPDLVKWAKWQAKEYGPSRILVEDSGLGSQLTKELQRAELPALAIKPRGSKEARFKAQTVKFEGERVFLVRGPWNRMFEEELLSVPNARFDDMVDALCIAKPRTPPKRAAHARRRSVKILPAWNCAANG